jgi:hypothetical protein
MHLTTYLRMLHRGEETLGVSYRHVADGHPAESDVYYTCRHFAEDAARHAAALDPVLLRYERVAEPEPDRLHPPGVTSARNGPIGLLRDLQDLYQLANFVDSTWAMVGQAGSGARDHDLIDVANRCKRELSAQLAWIRMRMKSSAPQTLLVAD